MAGVDAAAAPEPAAVVDGEIRRVGCYRDGDPHGYRASVEIVVGDVDVLVFVTGSVIDEEPRLILIVHSIKMVRRLGYTRRTLKIVEGGDSRVVSHCTVDVVGLEREERARQHAPLDEVAPLGEIDRLIAWTAWHAADPRRWVDRKLLGPSVAASC